VDIVPSSCSIHLRCSPVSRDKGFPLSSPEGRSSVNLYIIQASSIVCKVFPHYWAQSVFISIYGRTTWPLHEARCGIHISCCAQKSTKRERPTLQYDYLQFYAPSSLLTIPKSRSSRAVHLQSMTGNIPQFMMFLFVDLPSCPGDRPSNPYEPFTNLLSL